MDDCIIIIINIIIYVLRRIIDTTQQPVQGRRSNLSMESQLKSRQPVAASSLP